jgi:NADP-dependent 3-hydroxy acid dehydrogenase YdfG
MNKIALITGATSGIGEACAKKFAAAGYNLIITGRRIERLEALKTTIESVCQIKLLLLHFDVQNRKAVEDTFANLPAEWQNIDILINNAGLAVGRDSFEDADMDDWETMLNTNVHGLLYVSKAVVPLMIAQKKGHIINMGSIAGKEVYEKGNVYCASKFAVDARQAAATYNGIIPLTPEDIADTIFYCTQLPSHVCINDLVITCTQQASAYYFHKNT